MDPIGGAQYATSKWIQSEVEYIQRNYNAEIILISFEPHRKISKLKLGYLISNKIKFKIILNSNLPLSYLSDRHNEIKLAKLIKNVNFRNGSTNYVFLHCYNFFYPRLSLPKNTKLIMTFHDAIFEKYDSNSNNLPLFQQLIVKLWDILAFSNKKKLIQYHNFNDKFVTFHALSLQIKRDLIKMGIKPNNILLASNGLDVSEIEDRRKRFPVTHNLANLQLLSIGAIYPRKGYHLILKSLSELYIKNKLPTNFKYCIIGSKVPILTFFYEKYLKRLVNEFQLQKNVNIIVDAKYQTILSMLQNSNVFLSPSISEASNLSLIDAISNGLIVISTAAGDVFARSKKNSKIYIIKEMDKDLDMILSSLMKSKRITIANFSVSSWQDQTKTLFMHIGI